MPDDPHMSDAMLDHFLGPSRRVAVPEPEFVLRGRTVRPYTAVEMREVQRTGRGDRLRLEATLRAEELIWMGDEANGPSEHGLMEVSWALTGVSPRAIIGKDSKRHWCKIDADRAVCGIRIPWLRVHGGHEDTCFGCLEWMRRRGINPWA